MYIHMYPSLCVTAAAATTAVVIAGGTIIADATTIIAAAADVAIAGGGGGTLTVVICGFGGVSVHRAHSAQIHEIITENIMTKYWLRCLSRRPNTESPENTYQPIWDLILSFQFYPVGG
jgi:hypothetical protein